MRALRESKQSASAAPARYQNSRALGSKSLINSLVSSPPLQLVVTNSFIFNYRGQKWYQTTTGMLEGIQSFLTSLCLFYLSACMLFLLTLKCISIFRAVMAQAGEDPDPLMLNAEEQMLDAEEQRTLFRLNLTDPELSAEFQAEADRLLESSVQNTNEGTCVDALGEKQPQEFCGTDNASVKEQQEEEVPEELADSSIQPQPVMTGQTSSVGTMASSSGHSTPASVPPGTLTPPIVTPEVNKEAF